MNVAALVHGSLHVSRSWSDGSRHSVGVEHPIVARLAAGSRHPSDGLVRVGHHHVGWADRRDGRGFDATFASLLHIDFSAQHRGRRHAIVIDCERGGVSGRSCCGGRVVVVVHVGG